MIEKQYFFLVYSPLNPSETITNPNHVLSVKFCAGISSIVDKRAIRLYAARCLPRGQETAGVKEKAEAAQISHGLM